MKSFWNRCIFFVISLLLLTACQQEPVEPAPEPFKAGLLMLERGREVSLETFFGLINAYRFPISRISGLYYESELPADSLAYVNNSLSTKSYLNQPGWRGGPAYVREGKIQLYPWFYQMDAESQLDWIQATRELKLQEIGRQKQYFFIDVPEGSETHWRDILREEPGVASAELVYYLDFSDAPREE